jgi:hypothetical protein
MTDFGEVASAIFQSNMMDLNICLPVEIKKFNKAELLADVRPEFDAGFFDGSVGEAVTIFDVPVLYPMSSDSALVFPLKAGDKGIIVVSQRSIDNWRSNGSRLPDDSDLFPIGSCFLFPGVTHENMAKQHSKAKDAMGLYGKKVFIGDANATPLPASTLKNRDLVEMLEVALSQLKVATYPSAVGPAGPMVAPVLTIIEGIIAELGELKA